MFLEAKVQHKVFMSSFISAVEDITTWPAFARGHFRESTFHLFGWFSQGLLGSGKTRNCCHC